MTHISLTLVGLMWVLPFLYYHHAYPLTTFYQEWGAVILGLCAMPLLLTQRYWQQPLIPRVILLPAGLLLLVWVQLMLGKLVYLDQALLFTLYMMWVILLMMLGRRLRDELSLPVLVTVLAAFLLLGAELNALAGVLQHYRWHTFLAPVITAKTASAVYGNMAQPNHFANYIALGLASLGLLRTRWKLRAWQVVILATPLLFVLVLSGSRSSWLYLLCLAALAYAGQRRDVSMRPLLQYAALLLLGFGVMHLVVQIPWLAGATGNVTSVQRLFGEAPSGGIRWYLWRESWHIFSQFPVLGAGFGQFAWQHFLWVPQLHATQVSGLYNNAHNLIMQLAVEMGGAGLLILLGTLAMWVRQALNSPRTIYHWWGYALLSVLAVHSLLEYPLWYAYFLGVAAFILGMLDNTNFHLELRNMGRLATASMLLLGVISMVQLLPGYKTLEGVVVMRPESAADMNYYQRMNTDLMRANNSPLLHPYAEYYMSGMIRLDGEQLADKLELNERVMRFAPVGPVAYRQALLLALSGRQQEARLQLERSIWSYPEGFSALQRELNGLARKDPAHFAALLEFAIQKNEEYQIAVHTK